MFSYVIFACLFTLKYSRFVSKIKINIIQYANTNEKKKENKLYI